MRLLQRVREQLVGAGHVEVEMLAVMGDALVVEEVEQQRQRLLLDVAPRLEVDAEAVELVFAIAGPEAENETAAAQNVEERRVLGDPQRIGERQRHHRGADLDALRQAGEIAGIDEDVGHDAVFAREVMLGEPGVIEAELVGAQDLAGDAGMHVAVRIGLGIDVGMGGEQDSEFHARRPFGFAPSSHLRRGRATQKCRAGLAGIGMVAGGRGGYVRRPAFEGRGPHVHRAEGMDAKGPLNERDRQDRSARADRGDRARQHGRADGCLPRQGGLCRDRVRPLGRRARALRGGRRQERARALPPRSAGRRS